MIGIDELFKLIDRRSLKDLLIMNNIEKLNRDIQIILYSKNIIKYFIFTLSFIFLFQFPYIYESFTVEGQWVFELKVLECVLCNIKLFRV